MIRGESLASFEELMADEPDVMAFTTALKDIQGPRSIRNIAYRTPMFSTTQVWRLLNGKPISRHWSSYKLLLDAMGTSPEVIAAIEPLWRQAIQRVIAARRPSRSSSTASPGARTSGSASAVEMAEVAVTAPAKVVIHDGEVVINDPAVTAAGAIEIHGGTVQIGAAAVDAAAQIIVHGGKVMLGDPIASAPSTTRAEVTHLHNVA